MNPRIEKMDEEENLINQQEVAQSDERLSSSSIQIPQPLMQRIENRILGNNENMTSAEDISTISTAQNDPIIPNNLYFALKDLDKLRKKTSVRKKKVSSYSNLLGLREYQPRKISKRQRILNLLIKKKINTPEKIKAFMEAEGEKINDADAAFYNALISAQFRNIRISMSDLMSTKKLYVYDYITYQKTSHLTNDKLYWAMHISYTYSRRNNGNKDQPFGYLNCLNLERVGVYSLAVELNAERETGYIQDYDGKFLCLGRKTISDNDFDLMIKPKLDNNNNNISEFYFNYNGEQYMYRKLGECILICTLAGINEAKDKVRSTKYMKDKRNPTLGLKVIKYKNKFGYLDTYFKPVDFCPSYLSLSTEIEFTTFFKSSIDYNSYFNYLDTYNYEGVNSIPFYPDIIYWNTIDTFFTFFGIMRLTSKIPGRLLEPLSKLYDYYIEHKSIINVFGIFFKKIEDYLIEYYDGFNVSINLDKVKFLHTLGTNIKKSFDLIIKDANFMELKKFFHNLRKYSTCIYNQFNNINQLYNIVTNSINLLGYILEGDSKSLERNIRSVGLAIFSVFYYSDNRMFPVIRTPTSFLGNLIGDINEEQIVAVANKIKMQSIEEKRTTRILETDNIINDLLGDKKTLINIIADYAPDGDIDAFKEFIWALVNSNQGLNEANKNLHKYIINGINAGLMTDVGYNRKFSETDAFADIAQKYMEKRGIDPDNVNIPILKKKPAANIKFKKNK